MYVLTGEWVKAADKLILKQTELKGAVKAKDKGKSAALKKVVEKLHKDAQEFESSFNKAHDELVKVDQQFGVILQAAKSLSK